MNIEIVRIWIDCCLALIFLYSAGLKTQHFVGFRIQLGAFGLFPARHIRLLAKVVIGSEYLIGLCLLFQIQGSEVLASALLLFFTIFIAYLLHIGFQGSCHCFGSDNDKVSIYTLLRNLVLLISSTFGIVLPAQPTLEFLPRSIALLQAASFLLASASIMTSRRYIRELAGIK